jgi:hypothetical protein
VLIFPLLPMQNHLVDFAYWKKTAEIASKLWRMFL